MKRYLVLTIVLILIASACFAKTGLGPFGAMEMPGSSPVWIGATLRSIGDGLFGLEVAAMIEQGALADGDFTNFQILPTLYLCLPIGETFTVYAGAAPVVYVLGTSINIKQDAFYVRGGAQFEIGTFTLFLGASELFFIQGFSPSKRFGVEGGLTFNF